MDAYYRGGALGDHREKADIAVEGAKNAGQIVDKVLVWQRYPGKYSAATPMVNGRDFFVNDLLEKYFGEPIEPAVWKWHHKEVGKGKAIIVDTWWQTETGGFLCSTLPALKPMKPGSAGPGMPGIHPIYIR